MATTARLAKVKKSSTKEDVAAYFQSKGLSLRPGPRNILLAEDGTGSKSATVSFRDNATLKEALNLPLNERILNNTPFDIEDEFLGLTTLSEGSQADIVALHGMNGHAFNSWEHRDDNGRTFMWLRDSLLESVPEARVMLYGHDASILRDVSTGRLGLYADALLEDLLRMRSWNEATGRPLVFLTHSMGGLIIKQALIIASARSDGRFDSILNSVVGVVFLGTPHQDIHILKAGGFVATLMRIFDPSIHIDIKSFHTNFKIVSELTDAFHTLVSAKNIGIGTFIETRKTKIGLFSFLIVEEQSAILGVAGEHKACIDVDHINLSKFRDAEDRSLFAIIKVIKELRARVKPVVAPRLTFARTAPPGHDVETAEPRSCFPSPSTVVPPPIVAAAARISNIDESTTEEDLSTFLRSKSLPFSVDNRIKFTRTESGHKLATVSFLNEDTFHRAISLPHSERKLTERILDFDGDFDGFTILSEGTPTQNSPSQVDIVAVHGMNGHAFNSWEYRDDTGYSFMWLRDALPERIPEARVMVYGYNASVVADVSEGRIRSFAETFLERLLQIRKRNPVDDRPLILLGHSLGGLIIKQALIIANTRADGRFDSILGSACGVIFMGTPHRGLNGVETEEFVANFVGAFDVDARVGLIAEQHPCSMVLFDLTDDFRQLIASKGIDIATLYETKKTEREDSDSVWIVDEHSAILGVAGERKASINANHINLCRFEDGEDNSLSATMGYIEEFFASVVPRITTRHCSNLPDLPEDLKYASVKDPVKCDHGNSYPVLVVGEHWYYALCYNDDRDVMVILAFDKNGKIRGRWSKGGARHVHRIEYKESEGSRQVSFVDQDKREVFFRLAELKVTRMWFG